MKPELLLPVGNTESFYAALEGGADAVYLGLRNFNARGRAKNFAPNQLQSLLKEAEKTNLKVYLTLNTLIKNSELPQLLDMLHLISQTSLSAVIIQDLGVLYLLQRFFEKINIHGSTQMGIHNSAGTEFAARIGLERVILARELIWSELEKISRKTRIPLEVFAHGALCYSFSGMCLFSSYLGGMSANRGLCRQPCRRIFASGSEENYFFSLKDNELIRFIPELIKLQISSLKIEGRMKSAEYVYQTARAYRLAIDDAANIEKAVKILNYDLGRQKTTYFPGGDISRSISENPFTGILIGLVEATADKNIIIRSHYELKEGNRLRVMPGSGTDSSAIKIKKDNLTKISDPSDDDPDFHFQILADSQDYQIGDRVFLIGLGQKKFSSKFSLSGKKLQLQMPEQRKKNILQKIGSTQTSHHQQLFLRINDLDWLRKLHFAKFDFLIFNLTKKDWQQLDLRSHFLQKNISGLIAQFPKFIPEGDLEFFASLQKKLKKSGISNFMISHISQIEMFSKNDNIAISSSENVYILNDAAIQFLKEEKIKFYIFPLETDFPNLLSGKDRKGVVPLYFRPDLFYSRMPVLLNETELRDDKNNYRKFVRDGITTVVPELPVSLLQYRSKLQEKGFQRFLIDLSYETPSQNTFNRLLKKFLESAAEQPGSQFNFKLGLQ